MVQAVERAKQVTMAELNAIIGVRGLSILALILVCVLSFLAFLFFKFCSHKGAKCSRWPQWLKLFPSVSWGICQLLRSSGPVYSLSWLMKTPLRRLDSSFSCFFTVPLVSIAKVDRGKNKRYRIALMLQMTWFFFFLSFHKWFRLP